MKMNKNISECSAIFIKENPNQEISSMISESFL